MSDADEESASAASLRMLMMRELLRDAFTRET